MAPYEPTNRGKSKGRDDDYKSVSAEHSGVKKRTISRAEMMALIADRPQPETSKPVQNIPEARQVVVQPEPAQVVEPTQEAVIEAPVEDVAEVEPVVAKPPAPVLVEPEPVVELALEPVVEPFPETALMPEAPPSDMLPEVPVEPVDGTPIRKAKATGRASTPARQAKAKAPAMPEPPALVKLAQKERVAFGRVIRQHLLRLGLTQKETSIRLGYVNRGVFNNKMNGERVFKEEEIRALQELTGLTDDALIRAVTVEAQQVKP